MNILFIGDIFGKAGRKAIKNELPKIIQKNMVDCVIANAENTTHGRSLSIKHYNELKNAGINYFTFGNHTWHLEEVLDILKKPNVVRPMNLDPSIPESKHGSGSITFKVKNKTIRLTNLLGNTVECHKMQTNPFPLFTQFLKLNKPVDIHIVDFHTETTSEKNAFLLTFASKVSAILGTHTHVQSADEKIYKDTVYITDVGMTGGSLGVIGAEPETILDMFMGKSERFRLSPSKSKYQLNAVLLNFDDKTNQPKSIQRIYIYES
ncbi:MAG: TIGR00282 family metallophosphoesterase [Mycoplasmataceae bacterium]|jgi:metallophosphoesterase (TIGR00282 family)|nr:TIGR00282 family metallophosphoesterase [Mycoplasmataceae bacterium]